MVDPVSKISVSVEPPETVLSSLTVLPLIVVAPLSVVSPLIVVSPLAVLSVLPVLSPLTVLSDSAVLSGNSVELPGNSVVKSELDDELIACVDSEVLSSVVAPEAPDNVVPDSSVDPDAVVPKR